MWHCRSSHSIGGGGMSGNPIVDSIEHAVSVCCARLLDESKHIPSCVLVSSKHCMCLAVTQWRGSPQPHSYLGSCDWFPGWAS